MTDLTQQITATAGGPRVAMPQVRSGNGSAAAGAANGHCLNAAGLLFKQADQDWEFAEISQLNYASFVEEVPQHAYAANSDRTLVDRFHRENTYFICRRGPELVGMVCARDRRPFSLDEKLGRLEKYLPQANGASLCEVRLLAVRPDMRRTRVLQGLLTMMARHCQESGYDYVVMSGRVAQQQLYRRIGFIPFGPVVGDDAAPYQPMYRPVGNVGMEFAGLFHDAVSAPAAAPVILTPGPVAMPDAVTEAFRQPPLSHRSPEFADLMLRVRRRLCQLTNANYAAVMVGSGTMANDVVAAQLSRLGRPGVIVAAGEFGSRLCDHADRFGLRYSALRQEWGTPLDYRRIEDAVAANPDGWLWMVHCETSTGALADLSCIKAICQRHDTRLALDCISSIGAVPVDLKDVWLASGASGKGLAAYPGLGLAFCAELPQPDQTLPRYLDLGLHCAGADSGTVPFTLSSNLLAALDAGLQRQSDALLAQIDAAGRRVRQQLQELGLTLLPAEDECMGAVTTIAFPAAGNTDANNSAAADSVAADSVASNAAAVDAAQLGRALEAHGFYTSYASGYLRDRNWLQICLLGEVQREQLERLIPVLAAQIDKMTRVKASA